MKKYTTFINIRPVSITDRPNQKGNVEVRLRGGLTQISDGDSPIYEYDEYLLIVPEEENLLEKITKDFDNWFLTGRTLEFNNNASIVQEMQTGLQTFGVEGTKEIVQQAKQIQQNTKTKVSALETISKNYLVAYTETTGRAPVPEAGILVDICDPWEAGKAYKKHELFSYEGVMGFVKQDHTSQANWIPFTPGTESLYGARPKAVNGVYPYVYNMAIEIGMIVEHKGVKYRAIQNASELLYEPSAVPAILEVIEDAN